MRSLTVTPFALQSNRTNSLPKVSSRYLVNSEHHNVICSAKGNPNLFELSLIVKFDLLKKMLDRCAKRHPNKAILLHDDLGCNIRSCDCVGRKNTFLVFPFSMLLCVCSFRVFLSKYCSQSQTTVTNGLKTPANSSKRIATGLMLISWLCTLECHGVDFSVSFSCENFLTLCFKGIS